MTLMSNYNGKVTVQPVINKFIDGTHIVVYQHKLFDCLLIPSLLIWIIYEGEMLLSYISFFEITKLSYIPEIKPGFFLMLTGSVMSYVFCFCYSVFVMSQYFL